MDLAQINPEYLTTGEVATMLGLKAGTIRRAYRDGLLDGRAFQRGGWRMLFITPASVENYRMQHLGRRGRRHIRDKQQPG